MFPFTNSRVIASDPNEKKKSSMYPVKFFEYRHSTIINAIASVLNKLIDQKVFVWFCVKFDSRFIQIQDIFNPVILFDFCVSMHFQGDLEWG